MLPWSGWDCVGSQDQCAHQKPKCQGTVGAWLPSEPTAEGNPSIGTVTVTPVTAVMGHHPSAPGQR